MTTSRRFEGSKTRRALRLHALTSQDALHRHPQPEDCHSGPGDPRHRIDDASGLRTRQVLREVLRRRDAGKEGDV